VKWRKLVAIQPAVEVTVFVLAILPTFLVLTFAAMRLNFPLQDALLVRLDQAIGFDWPSYVRLVDRSAVASVVLGAAYESVFFQLTLLPLLLCASRLAGRAYRIVACYGLLVAISTAIAVFFPSVSAYGGYVFDGSTLSNVNSYNGYFFLKSFDAIRTDPTFVLGAGTAAGIVTFPSIHAGVAALLAWGAWPSPILRYPFLVLNVLMAVGAITHGAHYLVDIIAGLAIAWIVVRLSQWLARFAGSRRGERPAPAIA
jgi:membrane-associated phospholipid phosphatase